MQSTPCNCNSSQAQRLGNYGLKSGHKLFRYPSWATFLCQQFSKIDTSAYNPWAREETLKISNPPWVCFFILKGPEQKFQPNLTISFKLRVPVHSPSSLKLVSKNEAAHFDLKLKEYPSPMSLSIQRVHLFDELWFSELGLGTSWDSTISHTIYLVHCIWKFEKDPIIAWF